MSEEVSVVILGGCGFLGQHLISELLNEKTRDDPDVAGGGDRWNIKEIKVVDVKPYDEDCLTGQRKDSKIVKYEECDIRDFDNLTKALKGASAVFNCAAVTPNFRREDLGCGDHMNDVNVEGTRNMIKACQKMGIRVLIHTSSVSVKMGGKRLIEHTESLTPEVSQEELILGDYARGRLKAEQIVLKAHGTTTSDDVTLRTLVLRPPLMYGEGDTSFIPIIYSLAKASGNKIPSIGNPAAFTQAAYAGNIAVAHVCALKHLLSDEGRSELQSCGGLPVYVTDDSPPNNIADLTSPFLSHANIETSQKVPYWSTSLSLYMADFIHSFMAKIGFGTNEEGSSPPSSWPLHRFAGTIAVVSRMRAELCLGFTPVYSWEEAVKRSNLYYSRFLS